VFDLKPATREDEKTPARTRADASRRAESRPLKDYKVTTALGYDVGAALEEPDDH
jgi:hypothetical protein